MSNVVKSVFGGADTGAAERSAQGSALANVLKREGDVSKELGATGGRGRRRGRQLLTYLGDDGGQASLN